MTYRTLLLPFVMCGMVLTGLASKAEASVFYTFTRLTDNGNGNVATQLLVEVISLPNDVNGDSHVGFKFTNSVGTASSITDVYFDDGSLLGISDVTFSAGVAYSTPATPGNLPGANLATPAFVTTAGFSADSDSPITANGVNAASEWVLIDFQLIDGMTYADTLAALDGGLALRIGLKVQAIGVLGGSDSYINGGRKPDDFPPVPEPASLAIWGMGLGLVALVGRRFRRKNA